MALYGPRILKWLKFHISALGWNFIFAPELTSVFSFRKERTRLTFSRAKVCYVDSRRRRGVTDTHKVSESTWPARASSRRVRASGTTASPRQNEARPLRHVRHGEFSRPVVPDGHSRLPVAYLHYVVLPLTNDERDETPRKFAAK